MEPEGLRLHEVGGVNRLVLRDAAGVVHHTRRLPAPVSELSVDLPWGEPGTWTAELDGPGGPHTLSFEVPADLPPLVVRLDAPIGQGTRILSDGEVVEVTAAEGQPTELSLSLRALRAGPARIRLGEQTVTEELERGEQLNLRARLSDVTDLEVEAGGGRLAAVLRPVPARLDRLRAELSVPRLQVPADARGEADISRPSDRITLPAAWWTRGLKALSLGTRARDPWAPWTWVGLDLANSGDAAQSLVVRLRLVDDQGRPVEALAPRARDGMSESGAVQVLVRVPAGSEARVALPVYVDEAALQGAPIDRVHAELEVMALGLPEVLATRRHTLYVDRGNTWASLGLLGSLLAATAGTGLLLARSRAWLQAARTSELLTIALFGSLSFLVGLVGRLLTMAFSTLLGPFAILVSGLVDDVLRTALIATLLCLLPRPGTLSLFVLTSWLLSGLALGSFSPSDLIFVGARVFWLEALAWGVGLTRGTAWLDGGAFARFARLSVALGGASVLTSAIGMVLSVTLYRLHLAGWYVGLMLALPGFLYVVAGVALAQPFSESLRRVRR